MHFDNYDLKFNLYKKPTDKNDHSISNCELVTAKHNFFYAGGK
jgi:hypothetical protein